MSIVALFELAVAAFAGVIMYGEKVTVMLVAGGLLIVGGAVMVSRVRQST